MIWDRNGMDPEKMLEEYRRLIDTLGHDGLRGHVEHMTEAVEANPRDADALLSRGMTYAELGDHRRAVDDFSRLIAINPNDADAYHERARSYSKMDELRSAMEDYDTAIRLAPGDA